MSDFCPEDWFLSRLTRQRREILFAEALSQALDASLEISSALIASAEVNPHHRLRLAVRAMSGFCRQGCSLATALARTRIPVSSELLAALQVGEEHGSLANRLAEFVEMRDPLGPARLARAARRPAATRRFSSALSRSLEDQRLTPRLILEAARLADSDNSRLMQSIRQVVTDLEDGSTLSESLRRHPGQFDRFFCSLVVAPADRGRLRVVLHRLAGEARGSKSIRTAGS